MRGGKGFLTMGRKFLSTLTAARSQTLTALSICRTIFLKLAVVLFEYTFYV